MKNSDSATPGSIRRDARPPIASDSAPRSGVAEGHRLRRTVWPRAIVSPSVWESDGPGHAATSRYVRTFWTAAIGPGAVADLLRLATAAARGRSLLRPIHLTRLCTAGLAREWEGRLEVRTTIPALTPAQVRALPPRIRRLHAEPRWRLETGKSSAA